MDKLVVNREDEACGTLNGEKYDLPRRLHQQLTLLLLEMN